MSFYTSRKQLFNCHLLPTKIHVVSGSLGVKNILKASNHIFHFKLAKLMHCPRPKIKG